MAQFVAAVETQSEDDKFAVCRLTGVIDTSTFPNFQSSLYRFRRLGIKRLVLDMEDISYVNSLGFSILIKHGKLFKNDSGEVVLARMQPKVEMVADVLGLGECLRVFPTLEEAVKELEPAPAG